MDKFTEYQEEKISKFHKDLMSNVTGDKLVLSLFGNEIKIDKGVIEYVRNLRHMYYTEGSESDFPLTNLDSRPANIECSPMGIISKETGIPKFIGFYNRGGEGFFTPSWTEAIREYERTSGYTYPCILLTPIDFDIKLHDTMNLSMYFMNSDARLCVALTAGAHLNKTSYPTVRDGKVAIVGKPYKTERKKELHIYDVPISKCLFGLGRGVQYYNYRIVERDQMVGDAYFFDTNGRMVDKRDVPLYEKEVSREEVLKSKLSPRQFIESYGPFDKRVAG